ncbi:MAG: bifunctional diguanylate cyclase/phosphodiesterase [Sulfurimonas sp.]|jgi:diguanylate cyclase (GGDEF)-like protein
MFKKIIYQNKIYISVTFFFIVMFVYSLLSYSSNKERILKNIDERLLSTAIASQMILGNDFTDKAKDATSVSIQEDMKNIKALSEFAKSSEVKYIYIMVLDQNITRFISSSATDEEILTGKKLTRYYDSYDTNENVLKAFRTKRVTFDPWVKDEWGSFRSVFVPYTTLNNKDYVIGVDIDYQLIESLSREAAIEELLRVLLILLSLSPVLFLLNLFRKDNTILQQKINEATSELKEINIHLQDKVANQTQELFEQFYNDTLTNLPNRNKLQEDIHLPEIIAIAIIDIDDFKEINDYFGILVGDNILIQFSRFLDSYHPTYRLAGDQFALLFDHKFSITDIRTLLEKIVLKVEEEHFSIDSQIINLRLSIGLAYGENASLISADIAIHQAKTNKMPIAIYNEDEKIRSHFQHNLNMANTIKQAIINSKIVCYFQPIASFSDGKIEKYETLVRIIDENDAVISPLDFLELAKKTKHYPTITREVVRQACEIFSKRTEQFSINLSSSDITDHSIVDFILRTIIETKTADRVTFEILESEGIEKFEVVSSFIEEVKALGGRIAIDDFGSGYSSFENILKLNIDYIKIDGSLIRNIDTNMRHAIVVETIVDFSKKIGAKTIAEYVCNEDIYNKSKLLGIDYAQGYYIGKPDILS